MRGRRLSFAIKHNPGRCSVKAQSWCLVAIRWCQIYITGRPNEHFSLLVKLVEIIESDFAPHFVMKRMNVTSLYVLYIWHSIAEINFCIKHIYMFINMYIFNKARRRICDEILFRPSRFYFLPQIIKNYSAPLPRLLVFLVLTNSFIKLIFHYFILLHYWLHCFVLQNALAPFFTSTNVATTSIPSKYVIFWLFSQKNSHFIQLLSWKIISAFQRIRQAVD